MPDQRKPAGPPPSRRQLHEAALRHLSRFSATQAGLVAVLDRRLLRWVRAAEAEGHETEQAAAEAREAVRDVARALVAAGVIDDAAYAAARAGRMVRAGRSRRTVAAHLAAKGVSAAVADAAMPDPSLDLPSALAFARRRRIGPFRAEQDAAMQARDRGAFARAGFSRDVAEQALLMQADEASAIVAALRRG